MSTTLIIALAALGILFFVLGPLKKMRLQKMRTSIEGEGLAVAGPGNTATENFNGPMVVINGVRSNRSVGCPPTLLPMPDGQSGIGYVDAPQSDIKGLSGVPNPIDGSPQYEEPDGHFHYCTANMVAPPGATRLDCVFRVEADDDAELRPRTGPHNPSMISLLLQRKGEDLSGVGEKVYYRWFTPATYLWREDFIPTQGHGWATRGEFTISAPLDIDHWEEEDSEAHAANGAGLPNPPARREQFFREMLGDVQLVGFVCGGGDGKGHGVYAVRGKGNVRIVLVSRRFV